MTDGVPLAGLPAERWASPDPGISVWSARLAFPDPLLEKLAATLSDEESRRARSFVQERDRRRFTAGRAILRTLLAEYTAAPPEKLRFAVQDGTTKPYLLPAAATAPAPVFNLSNSEGRALIAITADRGIVALGIDLERIDPGVDIDGLAARFFSAPERAALAAIDDRVERVEAFFRCWTRKEALLKGIGVGLQANLDSFAVELASTGSFRPRGWGAVGELVAGWRIEPLEVEPGWAAALAVNRRSARRSVRSPTG